MKLPNAEQAVIDEKKVRDYLLSRAHAIGRFKAAFFGRAGFGPDDSERFISQVRTLIASGETEMGEATRYGQKYLVSGTLTGPDGATVEVTTVWIILKGSELPRL